MRKIKEIYESINGFRLKRGKWYKIHINGETMDRYWLIRFHSMNKHFIFHYKKAYVVSNEYGVQIYPCYNGDNHPLCYVDEIDTIERIVDVYKHLGFLPDCDELC